jgi:hypothetical protein
MCTLLHCYWSPLGFSVRLFRSLSFLLSLYLNLSLFVSVSCSPSKYYALFLVNRSYFRLLMTIMFLTRCRTTVIFFHWLYSPLGPWHLLFSFMIILQTVGLLGRVISSSQGLYLNTGQHQTSMPCVGFERTIPASERAKTVHTLDRSATVTGSDNGYACIKLTLNYVEERYLLGYNAV